MLIKVCGMREPENIRQVAETGIDWMGFIFYAHSARSIDNGKWKIDNERKSSSLNNSQFSIFNFQFPSFSQINSAAFLPLISMPPKIGPIRKLPLTPLAAIPETNNPG